MSTTETPKYSKKDFMSDQMIRWCPGCGDYSILSQTQTVFASMGIPREKFVVISGIGCNARFPYYMNTYGFHTIHGRAPSFATGLKTTRPDLSVWIITGDGDALSIGGNHLIHTLRRNVDLNILLFNNRIYGLTKGQYSPTSEVGKVTKSSPMGSLDEPFEPIVLALGAKASMVARTIDVLPKHLREMLTEASQFTGTSFVEIYQNCNIFNNGAFAAYTEKHVRAERILYVKHGEPLVWGTNERRGLVRDGGHLAIVALADDDDGSGCLVHDETNANTAGQLAALPGDDAPVVVGVLYRKERPTYDAAFRAQVDDARARMGQSDLEALLHAGDTWNVE